MINSLSTMNENILTKILLMYQSRNSINYFYSSGCATSEDMFWKLGALQTFIADLQWPEEEFRGHLERRMKSLAADIIGQCTQK